MFDSNRDSNALTEELVYCGGLPVTDMEKRKEAALRPLEEALKERLYAEAQRRRAQQLAAEAERILSSVLTFDWQFDSYSEQCEAFRELCPELRAVVNEHSLAGELKQEELRDYVQDWVADRLNETDED